MEETPVAVPTPQQQTATQPSIADTLIPPNGPALASYYLGVFGLIPILGLPLSVAAIIFGKKGLAHYAKYPEKRGKTHAMTGLILGIVELSIFVIFVGLMVLLSITDK